MKNKKCTFIVATSLLLLLGGCATPRSPERADSPVSKRADTLPVQQSPERADKRVPKRVNATPVQQSPERADKRISKRVNTAPVQQLPERADKRASKRAKAEPVKRSPERTNSNVSDSWQLRGKIALAYPAKRCQGSGSCGRRSEQGKIHWKQRQQNYHVRLSDPFNRILMTIDGNAQSLKAQGPEQPLTQTSPNEFIAVLANNANSSALSNLSPEWLRYWVTGHPAPKGEVSEKRENTFVQHGYQITARKWKSTPVGRMPTLVLIEKNKSTLRLVIGEWAK